MARGLKRHLAYAKYLFRHKLFVLLACRDLEVPLFRALIHDWSKFLPSEWGPYARTFYKEDGSKQYVETDEFNEAWNYHQKRQRHHWQYWTLKEDSGKVVCIRMPEVYVREMVADWIGAGRAITGKTDVLPWYEKNKAKIQLHPETRKQVVDLILRYDIHRKINGFLNFLRLSPERQEELQRERRAAEAVEQVKSGE